jgi:predicted Rdx family selenoprotein
MADNTLMPQSSSAQKRKSDGTFVSNKFTSDKVSTMIKSNSDQISLKKYGKENSIMKQCYFSEDGDEEKAERINFVYCSQCGTVLTSNNQGGGHIT